MSDAIKTRWQAFFWKDAIAGLSIAGLLLPEAVAYSNIGNMPPQTGIIALFAGLICFSIFGQSRFAIVTATSSSAALLAASIASLSFINTDQKLLLAFGLVIFTGVFFILAGIAKMGNVTDYISKPVLRGFAFGLAVTIVFKQFVSMSGVRTDHGDILRAAPELLQHFHEWNLPSIAVGGIALLLLILSAQFKRLPSGLLVIFLGILAEKWLHLSQHSIALVGSIDLNLESPTIPTLYRNQWLRLGELAFAMSMILYSESYGSIRTFAMKHGDQISPNRDLIALGISNLISGLFHGMPVGAGFSGTSANETAGAYSRLSGLIAAIVIFGIVLTMLPSIGLTPEPVLAAIVMRAVGHTINPKIFDSYFKWRRDRIVIIVSILGVLFLGVLDGLLFAIGISIMMMLRQFAESRIAVLGQLGEGHDYVDIEIHPEAKPIPHILILRPDEPLFFANADRILNQAKALIVESSHPIQTIILSLEESPNLDSTSLEALSDFFAFVIQHQRKLILARLKHPVHELLKQVITQEYQQIVLTGLSVDDAVTMSHKRPH